MDNEPNTPMQVDPSTNTMSAIQAFKMDPSTEWVIESAPGFVAIKHKMGCSICDASASHCMVAKRSYEIRLAEKDVSHAVAEAWPELVRYQDDYYRLLEDYNVLKESVTSVKAKAEERRAKLTQLYDRLDSRRVTIQNLGNQVQSLEKELQEAKDNSAELSPNEVLVLENKRLKKELEYYVGRAQYVLHGKDPAWAEKNEYCISNIPMSDGEDDDEDPTGLPTIPEDIPQNIPVIPPNCACPASKTLRKNARVVREAGIPAIGGYHPPPKQKRIIADPPASIMGVPPKPLGKARAERWDQPAFRGTSEWIMEHDVHESEMRRLYAEGKALQPHEWSPDHTAIMFCIDENLVAHHDDSDWMTEVIQSFNANPSGVPRNLRLEGLHVNVDNADIWYWVNLIKPKYRGAEAEVLLQHIFSSVGRWDQLVAGRWKRNDSIFLCSPAPARYTMPRHQKLDKSHFAYWLGCDTGVAPTLAREKLKPYFIGRSTRTIWNEVTLCSQLRANEIASLKGGIMNHFRVHEDLLPLVQESPFYFPPTVGEPMDQDKPDPEPYPIQHTAGSASLADRLDYGEGSSFSQPPADARELRACISYYDSLVSQGTTCASTAELTEELTRDLYTDHLE
ncbi:hypothetical protein M422DRAFT_248398 [Sphaerobolus stellatus SS14]|uniref:Uncharacterized protein n=1 Tax=Sphaerobolus stellatus (strain SS14) TaxID=990650 RepID=A0A0C9VIP9_SPHS4|nr:hypothetical protein M422DRAFT_248398 [Sphaerobolus stellatus SS14]